MGKDTKPPVDTGPGRTEIRKGGDPGNSAHSAPPDEDSAAAGPEENLTSDSGNDLHFVGPACFH